MINALNIIKFISIFFCTFIFLIFFCDNSIFIMQLWSSLSLTFLIASFFAVQSKFKTLNVSAKKRSVIVFFVALAYVFIHLLYAFIYPNFEYTWWVQLPIAQQFFYLTLLMIVGLNRHGYNESGPSWHVEREIQWGSISAAAKYSGITTFTFTCGAVLLIIQSLYFKELGISDSLKFLVTMLLNHMFLLVIIEALRIRTKSSAPNVSINTSA